MPKRPIISIITVNLNNLSGLKRTMCSVFEQTYIRFEYIVIDGGSTDGSKEYIEKYKEKINYWVSEPDKGIYNGMNKGIRAANGEFLLFLNSGDQFFTSTVLKENFKFLTHDLVYFNIQVNDIGSGKAYIKHYPEKLSFSYFIRDSLPHPATFIRSTLFENVGLYDEELKIVSDWKFFLNSVCKFNCSYKKIDGQLSIFYNDGISSVPENKNLVEQEKQGVLEKDYKAFIEDIVKLNRMEKTLYCLRNSRKIKLMISLGWLKKF